MDGEGVRRVQVTIYGETYWIRGEGIDESYIQGVAARVDRRMRELARRMPHLDMARLAVLAAVNLADELTRLEQQYRELLDRLATRLGELEAAAGAGPAAAGATATAPAAGAAPAQAGRGGRVPARILADPGGRHAGT